MDVEEMDRIEVPLGATSGHLLVDGERQPLPAGSTLKGGVFYWQLAPGFLGEYNLVFSKPGAAPTSMRISVGAKTYSRHERILAAQ